MEEEGYRIEVLIILRKLERLDKEEFQAEERDEAEEIYEQRRQEEMLKEGEVDDVEQEVEQTEAWWYLHHSVHYHDVRQGLIENTVSVSIPSPSVLLVQLISLRYQIHYIK